MKIVPVPSGVICSRFHTGATKYLRAAKVLIDAGEIKSPLYFLLGHGLELAIKSYLMASGISLKEITSRKIGHNLENAYKRAVEIGFSMKNEEVLLVIRCLSEFHSDSVFRYPIVNKEGELVRVGATVDPKKLLSVIQEVADYAHPHVMRGVIRSAGEGVGGQYKTVTWIMGGRDAEED